jgi:hypothetical protein
VEGCPRWEKTGEMGVLRPGAKDGAWVDLPDNSSSSCRKGVIPFFRFVGGARERQHRPWDREQSGLAVNGNN